MRSPFRPRPLWEQVGRGFSRGSTHPAGGPASETVAGESPGAVPSVTVSPPGSGPRKGTPQTRIHVSFTSAAVDGEAPLTSRRTLVHGAASSWDLHTRVPFPFLVPRLLLEDHRGRRRERRALRPEPPTLH